MLEGISIAIIRMFNRLIAAIGSSLTAILSILPESPFLWVDQIDSMVLEVINWVFPVNAMISHLQLYVTAVAIYYAIRIALRWAKAAGG